MKNKIKGILVTFFREGTKGDYLEALNKAQNELLTVMEASKNLVQPDVIKSVCEHKNTKYSQFCNGDMCTDCGEIL